VPHQATPQQLETLLNGLLQTEEKVPFAFYIEDREICGELSAAMLAQKMSVEKVVSITYRPQAVFRVRPVGRCSATMAGAPPSAYYMTCHAMDRGTVNSALQLYTGFTKRGQGQCDQLPGFLGVRLHPCIW
jgi:hypothetical protein